MAFDKLKRIFNKETIVQANPSLQPVPNTYGGRSVQNPNSLFFNQPLARLKQDVLSWRVAINEVEQTYYPQRVKIQQLYQDTVLNGHVAACMEKRKRLTLLKEFCFVDENGNELEQLTKQFKKKWFYNFMNYVLDAQAYGYSLISLGDIVDDTFPDLSLIRRYNVSPERLLIQNFMYAISGIPFTDPNAVDDYGNKYIDWTAYVDTPSESGVTKCGLGYLYKIGVYEIYMRNVLGYNGDFVELFAQPYRVGKTDKSEGEERDTLEQALRDMGSSGYAIIDPVDEISFLETALGGTGYKGYESLEKRCEEKVSKIILGHASALDSTSGKLGNPEDVKEAMEEVQKVDNRFVEEYMNETMIDKFRVLGFNIPFGASFYFKNNHEEQEHLAEENTQNQAVSTIAKTMKEAGMEIDEVYFTERTGIPFTKVEVPVPAPSFGANKFGEKVQAKLKKLYDGKNKG